MTNHRAPAAPLSAEAASLRHAAFASAPDQWQGGASDRCRQDGAAHDLLVSACSMEDPFFASFFHPERCKRTEERVTALQLSWAPLDPLSARPVEISLRGARVLRRQGVEFVTAPLPEPKKEQ